MRGWFLISALLLPGCAAIRGVAGSGGPTWADGVVITRDAWGVPRITAETDAAAAFGIAVAQAEDNFWQVEENVLRAIGRAANLYGETELAGDLVRAAFDVTGLARAEYAREPPESRMLWDAYAAGLNHYLATHPEVRPRLIWNFEPWQVFAVARDPLVHAESAGLRFLDATGIPDTLVGGAIAVARWDSVRAAAPFEPTRAGSARAVAPTRTAAGHALLAQAALLPFFGADQPWEATLETAQGWHVTGRVKLGTPIPQSGHNAHLAWAHTRSGSDVADVYALTFDHPSDPLAYRWSGEWRRAEPFTVTIPVNTTAGVVERSFTFVRTHHGPLVARHSNSRFLVVRIARLEEGGALQQWYAMNRATSLAEFRGALEQTALVGLNTMYADTAGNIYYVHGNAVPRRGAGVDPQVMLDGGDPATDWTGYHPIAELPALLNPGSGWIQNAGSSPFLATATGYNLDRQRYPVYMAPEPDHARASRTRALLAAEEEWTLDAWQQTMFDVEVTAAERWIPRLIDEYERRGATDPTGVLPLDESIGVLRAWDRRAAIDSPEMTVFALWLERVRRPGGTDGTWPLTSALAWALERIERQGEDDPAAWGVVNRLQRIHTSGAAQFEDDAPSLPVSGAPGWAGTAFQIVTRAGPDHVRGYAVAGSAWLQVVELAPRTRSRSIIPFGQSADPASAHYFDQAARFSRAQMKETEF